MTSKTNLTIEDYRIIYDDPAHPASGAACVFHDNALWMTFLKASDAELGLWTSLTRSDDLGQTWSPPVPFGPPIIDPAAEFQGVCVAHSASDGRLIACGFHRPRGITECDDMNWRPGDALIGRQRAPGSHDFDWTRYPSGTFQGEQFVASGIRTRSGRIVFTIWGAMRQGENWWCGVLLSDDDAQTLCYRGVAYEPDLSIRADPSVTAGYNEQTIFETLDGRLVSLIRGRDAIGAIHGSNPGSSEALFTRCVSSDGGATWSSPELTNLPGTGAASDGFTLPDGSLLMAARMPTVWTRHDHHSLHGLHIARSYDAGKSWETECVFYRDPEGFAYDDYYNAMNGQFMRLDENRAMYVFGYFQHRQDRHRVNAVTFSWSPDHARTMTHD